MGEKEKLNKEKVEQEKKSNKKIIKTDIDAKDGQNKCPKCGATDISLNSKTGKLRCNFCRHQFEPEKLETMEKDISKLEGEVLGSGATDIIADVKDILTFKCSSCGAEVVIDTSSQASARCHWCRNTLSVNQQIPNGAIPDTVLPFKVSKVDAKKEIENFVGKRKFYAHPEFRKEFTTDNIMGVYLPYMIVDANTHISLTGQGEHEVNRYTEKIGDRTITYYDADLYEVERDFDLIIEGLTIESSKDKLDTNSSNRTNNIINSIMPFDTENCVKWDANYIKGYTSEKRDTNVDDLKGIVEAQSKDIARFAANETLEDYDRGVRWDNENLKLKGQQWKAAYLPIWLYSYQEEKKDKKLLHYVAVNARTKKTMGSVPIHMPKLLLVSFFVELAGLIAMLFTYSDDNNWPWLFLLSGVLYFLIIYGKYRNSGARHNHEKDTKTNMSNLVKSDKLVRREKRLSDSRMEGANNTRVDGSLNSSTAMSLLDKFK